MLAAPVADGPEYNYFELSLAAEAAGAPRYGSFFVTGGAADDVGTRVFGSIGNYSLYSPLTSSSMSDKNNLFILSQLTQ